MHEIKEQKKIYYLREKESAGVKFKNTFWYDIEDNFSLAFAKDMQLVRMIIAY
jgi:hypothetical protein